MDIVLTILSMLCLITGLAGCLLPFLPGPPLAWLGMLLFHFTDKAPFTPMQLFIWALLVILVQVIDYLTPMWGTRRWGGTSSGKWGSFIGTIAGLLFFPPWGILVGPFAGAALGELVGGNSANNALKAGFGAFYGFLFGVALKLMVCALFLFYFVKALLF